MLIQDPELELPPEVFARTHPLQSVVNGDIAAVCVRCGIIVERGPNYGYMPPCIGEVPPANA